jgi:hypothetical protein
MSTVLRRTALVLTSLFVVGGLLFALGYTFEDPGGWAAVLIAAAIVLPLVGLTVLAARAAPTAVTVLTWAVVAFAAWAVVNRFVEVDAPTIPVIALVLALPIAVVGQRNARRAGQLLLAVAAVPLLLLLVRLVTSGGDGPGALLGGSTGVVVLPLVVLAALFLAAGAPGRAAPAPGRHRVPPPTPAGHR